MSAAARRENGSEELNAAANPSRAGESSNEGCTEATALMNSLVPGFKWDAHFEFLFI